MFHVMSALNIEHGIDDLQYHKVIIATDDDVDGMHIRNLIITFFVTYFESLVINDHLYILETPLFKVRSSTKINCTNFDKLLIFYDDGVYKVISIEEKDICFSEKCSDKSGSALFKTNAFNNSWVVTWKNSMGFTEKRVRRQYRVQQYIIPLLMVKSGERSAHQS
ncbi:hypothetical protein ACTFIW_000868 [Dictyostelium discoideum]